MTEQQQQQPPPSPPHLKLLLIALMAALLPARELLREQPGQTHWAFVVLSALCCAAMTGLGVYRSPELHRLCGWVSSALVVLLGVLAGVAMICGRSIAGLMNAPMLMGSVAMAVMAYLLCFDGDVAAYRARLRAGQDRSG
jgi:hypothetical protein